MRITVVIEEYESEDSWTPAEIQLRIERSVSAMLDAEHSDGMVMVTVEDE